MESLHEIEDWTKVAVLGSGSFGIVTLWQNRVSHERIAIKTCRWMQPETIPQKQRERWIQEVEFMKRVQHENIVHFKKVPNDFLAQLVANNPSGLPLLSMEYCGGGNLRRFINLPENACGLRENCVRSVLSDLSAGLKYLHQQQITHRDIKPENVVIQQSKPRPVYKIIDLGYAKDMNLLTSYVGTLAYTAPEIFMNSNYNHSVDYWSLGVLAYEICCGKHPFIPNVAPVERFQIMAKKAARDICIYKSQANKIIYTDRIMEPHHLSSCLRTHLEDWLGAMLQYDGKHRGQTQSEEGVFGALNNILQKKIVTVFSVYNYSRYHYEIDDSMSIADFQRLLENDCRLAPNQQLIITSNIAASVHICKQQDDLSKLDDLFANSNGDLTVSLFKRGDFVPSQTIVLPPEVKQLLQQSRHQWDELKMRTSNAVHYIEQEVNLMKATVTAIGKLNDCVHVLLTEKNELSSTLGAAVERLLNIIDFCKQINRNWGSSLPVYKKLLWKSRELIENANSANGRHQKLQMKLRLLNASYKKISKYFGSIDIDDILYRAKGCLQMNKQKVINTAKDIAIVICSCLKLRKEIQQHNDIIQHVNICFKMLSEHKKLAKWMHALTAEAKQISAAILNEQRNLSQNELVANAQHSTATRRLSWDASKHTQIISENRTLRFQMQERLNELLQYHKQHAVSVSEFVCYANALTIENGA